MSKSSNTAFVYLISSTGLQPRGQRFNVASWKSQDFNSDGYARFQTGI